MANGSGPPTPAKPGAFYGVIQSAVAVRATTAETWQAIRDYSARNNLALPASMFTDVNTMRGLAARNRNASDTLTAARYGDALTNRMVGTQIFARSPADMAANAKYRVDFTVSVTSNGVQRDERYHLMYSWANLPTSVGELKNDVHAASTSLASIYGTDVVDVTDIAIGAY